MVNVSFIDSVCWSSEFIALCVCVLIPYSYRNNPALGDAHSLKIKMVLMCLVMREMEADMKLIQGKVGFVVNVMIVHV